MYTYKYIYTCIFTNECILMYVYMHVCTCIYTCMNIHTYTYMYIHVYFHLQFIHEYIYV